MFRFFLASVTALAVVLAGAILLYRAPLSAAAAISATDMAYVEKTRYTTLYDRNLLDLCRSRYRERGGTVGRCLALSAESIKSPIGRFLLVAAIHAPDVTDVTAAEKKDIVATTENVLLASLSNPVWPKYQLLLDACDGTLLPCPILGRPHGTSITGSLGRMREIVASLQGSSGDASDIKLEIERIAKEAAEMRQ